jgi:hypothetical protein
LLEFEIPEPGAWWRWLQKQGEGKGLTTKAPEPFTLNGKDVSATNPPIAATDISDDPTSAGFYLKLGGRYATVGLTPPPADQVVATSLKRDSIEDEGTPTDPKEKQPVRFAADATMAIPDGYQATDWSAYIASNSAPFVPSTPGGTVYLSVGAGDAGAQVTAGVTHALLSGKVGNISRGIIPVSVMTVIERGFAINVNVTCTPTPAALKKWQINAYDQIAQAYFGLKRQYEEELAASAVRRTAIDGSSAGRNKEVVRDELKKLVVEMLTGSDFRGRPALKFMYPNDSTRPQVDLVQAPKVSSEIQFLEQAFEWENMSYIFYPYYWADDHRWSDLAGLESADPDFARFLRAGSARVVVPARPGFEEQVNLYTAVGVLWGGGPVPSPADEGYISVAEEIKAQHEAPQDGDRGESWEVRLPTTLIWLENQAGLPEKPKAQQELDKPPGKTL